MSPGPSFSSSLVPLTGFTLGLPDSQMATALFSYFKSRASGKKTYLCPDIPTRSALVSHGFCMSCRPIPEPITWVQVPTLPFSTLAERHMGRKKEFGFPESNQSITSPRRGCTYWKQKFKWLNIGPFNHFPFSSESPRKLTSFLWQHSSG